MLTSYLLNVLSFKSFPSGVVLTSANTDVEAEQLFSLDWLSEVTFVLILPQNAAIKPKIAAR